jgi:hypothetical protein
MNIVGNILLAVFVVICCPVNSPAQPKTVRAGYVSISTGAPALPGTNKFWEGVGVQPNHITAPGGELEFIERKLGEGK